MMSRRAFTLIELLTVVLIAFVVSLILYFASRDFIVRTKVMKVREEHALLSRALENYRIDYKRYPPPAPQLASLMAPTTYLASLPEDPFSEGPQTPSYIYFRDPGGGLAWLLASPGPDGKIDFVPLKRPVAPRPPESDPASAVDAPDDDEALRLLAAHARARMRTASSNDEGASSQSAGAAALVAPTGPGAAVPGLAEGPPFDDRPAFQRYLMAISYDPTNGTMSAGDIIAQPDH